MARVFFPSLQRWWRLARAPGLPRIVAFTATRLPVTEGGAVTLAWQVDGAATVRIEPGLGEVPTRGVLRTRVLPADGRYDLLAEARGGTVRAACRIAGPYALTDALDAAPAAVAQGPAPHLSRIRARLSGGGAAPRPRRRVAIAHGVAARPTVAAAPRHPVAHPRAALRARPRIPTFDPRDLPA
jgi:hypothetical protein